MERCIGLDVGKRECTACIVDHEGFVLDEFSFENDTDGIDELLARLWMIEWLWNLRVTYG